MGMASELRIDEFLKFLTQFALTRHDNMLQIFLKTFGFEDSVFIQRSVPLDCARHLNLP